MLCGLCLNTVTANQLKSPLKLFSFKEDWSAMGAVECMDLDNGLQRERSQSPKATWCVIQNSQNRQKQKRGGQGWVYRESLEFPSGPKKVFGTRERSWACKLIDTVSATELHAVE